MNLSLIGTTLNVIGEVLIGIAVLFVHKHIIKENKIDKDVLKQMKKEQLIGFFGILFILAGYFMHLLT